MHAPHCENKGGGIKTKQGRLIYSHANSVLKDSTLEFLLHLTGLFSINCYKEKESLL